MTVAAGLIAARLVHYCAVSVLFGLGLFPLYATGLPAREAYAKFAWVPRQLLYAALLAVVSGAFWYAFAEAGSRDTLAGGETAAPGSQAGFSVIWGARLALSVIVAAMLFMRPAWTRIYGVLAGAAILLVGLAAVGRSDTSEAAAIHIFADAMHLVAGAIWLGALLGFVLMIAIARRTAEPADAAALRVALVRFAEPGEISVAVLLFTGLLNPNVLASLGTRYGQVLMVKIVLFGTMLALALVNRLWLTPKLARALESNGDHRMPLRGLQNSIAAETAIAVLVFALVAWLGLLSPRG